MIEFTEIRIGSQKNSSGVYTHFARVTLKGRIKDLNTRKRLTNSIWTIHWTWVNENLSKINVIDPLLEYGSAEFVGSEVETTRYPETTEEDHENLRKRIADFLASYPVEPTATVSEPPAKKTKRVYTAKNVNDAIDFFGAYAEQIKGEILDTYGPDGEWGMPMIDLARNAVAELNKIKTLRKVSGYFSLEDHEKEVAALK